MTEASAIPIVISPARRALASESIELSGCSLLERCQARLRDAGFESLVSEGDGLGLSPFLPFVDVELLKAICQCWEQSPICVLEAHPHPVGSFFPKRGIEDYSSTLNSKNWRDLEDLKVYHPCALIAGTSLLERREDQPVFVFDKLSAFEVRDAGDLELARRIETRPIEASGIASGEGRAKWRKL